MLFTSIRYYYLIILIGILFCSGIIFYKKKKYEKIFRFGKYLILLTLFISIFIYLEDLISGNLTEGLQIIMNLEMILILILYSLEFYIIHKRSVGGTYYIYIAIIIILFHVVLSGILLPFPESTFMIIFLSLIISVSLANLSKEQKRIFQITLIGWYIYLNYKFIGISYYEIISLIIIFVILLGYRPIINYIIHFYHTLIILLIGPFIKLKSLNNKTSKKSKLYKHKGNHYLTTVEITQIGKVTNEDQKKKQKIATWLKDYFRVLKANRVQINLKKGRFEFKFIILTETEKEGIMKGNKILTDLESEYPGLDGKVSIRPFRKSELYMKERWYRLRIPKPPYETRFELINHLITIFEKKNIDLKISLIWKKAPERKVPEMKARVLAMKYKDKNEKENFIRMWRRELFYMGIYINYNINGNNAYDEFEIEGILKSLEISIRNTKKVGKIKKVSCGTRADFYRGIIPHGNYLTPLTFDFTFTEKMPIHTPRGLKNQTINFRNHTENSSRIPIGYWINKYGKVTEKLIYLNVDDLDQGLLIVGKTGSGKTYVMGNINKHIREKRPEVGILVINYKREIEENIYSAERQYTYGKNLKVPYMYPVDASLLEKHISETSKGIMGALGFQQEAFYACSQELMDYIIKNKCPPSSIRELLKLTRAYFFKEKSSYDIKYQNRITSAIYTRLNFNLNKTVEDILNPFNEALWYEEWISGKTVQINLVNCNDWIQRLLTILILLTIKTLTPNKVEDSNLKLIEIDEAHRIIGKNPDERDPENDEFIASKRVGELFHDLAEEYRDRFISFITADQQAHKLRDTAISSPSSKIILAQDLLSIKRLASDPSQIEYMKRMENRIAIFDSNSTGDLISFKTIDFTPTNSTSLCLKCGEINEESAKFCSQCGSKIN